MLYLSGKVDLELDHELLGWMLTPQMKWTPPTDAAWAADNGCYARPHAFVWSEYEAWLGRCIAKAGDRLLFATTPDVMGDGAATLARFEEYRDRMDAIGARIALVIQDGMTADALPWGQFGAVFIGGTDEWRFGPDMSEITAETKRRGLYLHMGRVNSWSRIAAARSLGCDSVDGTFLRFALTENRERLRAWLDRLDAEAAMVLA